MKFARRGCLILFVITTFFATGRVIYGLTRPSALGQLAVLARIDRTTDLAHIQTALLGQLPIGTSTRTLERYLHDSGVIVDVNLMLHSRNSVAAPRTITNNVACYPTDFTYGFTCLVIDDPDRLTFPC